MSTMAMILLLGAVLLMILGLPIAMSLGMAGIAAIAYGGKITLMVFAQRLFTAVDSFSLMAIIFFVMAGEFMLQGGISKRLVNFASAFLGWMRGSLAVISLVTCAFFGAISGSALATTAAVGSVLYPEMIEDGSYERAFAATLQAVGGTLGILIPPSITLILYGTMTGASIGKLFLSIIVPGLMMMFLYMAAAMFVIVRKGYAIKRDAILVSVEKSLLDGIWALLTPVIILGGIYGGIFTPTESAIVASFYTFIVGRFVYKELDLQKIKNALVQTAVTSASIMFLIACAMFFGWVMTNQNIPQMVTNFLMSVTDSKLGFLMLVNLVLLVAGMFMETSTILLLVIPLVFPLVVQYGIDLIHFGVICTINLSLGMITPPFGASLFVAAGFDHGIGVDALFKQTVPFIVAGLVGILLCTFVPWLSFVLL